MVSPDPSSRPSFDRQAVPLHASPLSFSLPRHASLRTPLKDYAFFSLGLAKSPWNRKTSPGGSIRCMSRQLSVNRACRRSTTSDCTGGRLPRYPDRAPSLVRGRQANYTARRRCCDGQSQQARPRGSMCMCICMCFCPAIELTMLC